jgi:hypothetical protein
MLDYRLSNPAVAGLPAEEISMNPGYAGHQQALPKGINPTECISGACNPSEIGAGPETYAKFLGNQNAGRKVYPGEQPPLRLNRVVMAPRGTYGVNGHGDQLLGEDKRTNTRKFVDTVIGNPGDSAAAPYTTNMNRTEKSPISALNDFRLKPGGNAYQEQDWVDTGTYTDARQEKLPWIGLPGEMREIGRHTALPPEYGGGGLSSYIDKVDKITSNPDATYAQKVRSSLARPVGSALSLGRAGGQAMKYVGTEAAKELGKTLVSGGFAGMPMN